ncbi:peroxiredoxin [Carnobacteriaceae bacterium zg-ZUI240]|nr:peroxiredoxin [Carnobacteriaceae bacterium zg-ZUI240]
MFITRKDYDKTFELFGTQPTLNDKAPDFTLPSTKGRNVSLHDLKGQVTILSVVPNINTRVCAIQTREFNQRASQLKGINFFTIARNTLDEFSQWCAGEGLDLENLSDVDGTFGKAYGLIMSELNLLARSVFVIDQSLNIAYMEIVSEMTDEPAYQAPIKKALELL